MNISCRVGELFCYVKPIDEGFDMQRERGKLFILGELHPPLEAVWMKLVVTVGLFRDGVLRGSVILSTWLGLCGPLSDDRIWRCNGAS